MDLGLQGKTAIVTGGASNIGKAITEGFVAEGANVVIADVDEKQGQRVARELCDSRADAALFVKTDVGDREAVEKGSDKHPEKYSDFGPVTVLPLRDPVTLE